MAQTSVGPEDDVCIFWVIPAFKKVGEKVAGLDVDVASICAVLKVRLMIDQRLSIPHLAPSSQKLLFLMHTP
jgi:hypothetical protein